MSERAIFPAALDKDPSERPAFLDEAHGMAKFAIARSATPTRRAATEQSRDTINDVLKRARLPKAF